MTGQSLVSWAKERGYKAACGSIETLVQSRKKILQQYQSAELDFKIYDSVLKRFAEEADIPPDGTLVIVVVPRPAHRVSFQLDERRFDALMPPTYFNYYNTTNIIRDDLAANLLADSRVEPLVAPLKGIAARLGLVRYGKNNITYTNDFGSYFQLCGYVTDAAIEPLFDESAAPGLLPECENCDLCTDACPTGAIAKDRFLLRAQHCLTFANELPGDWPQWLNSRSHHCLIGCLICQRSCPANPPLQIVDTNVCFSAEETQALINFDGAVAEPILKSIEARLEQLGQPMPAPILSRNLRALIDKRSAIQIKYSEM